MNHTDEEDILIAAIGRQSMGIGISSIVDVLHRPQMTSVPLSGKKCAGVANLRGNIVTMIDVRACLGMKEAETQAKMAIVVVSGKEFYGLLFDSIGDIISTKDATHEDLPTSLAEHWHTLANGILKLPNNIIVVLNAAGLIDSARPETV